MSKDKNKKNNKMFYFFIFCLISSLLIIGATFAYFAANAIDEETVKGTTATTNFSMYVNRVTSVDMAFGLIPMKNEQSPHAAEQMCYDDNGNAGCQIYKITINVEGDDTFFVDGYINTETKDDVETRFTRVYPKEKETNNNTEEIFETKYSKEDFLDDSFNQDDYIKDGNKVDLSTPFNLEEDYNCLLVRNEQVGGTKGKSVDFYVMIWVYDNGSNQDYMQGMEQAYTGIVTFVTASGNEIKATFD
jgi:hypothetical protein